jgi:itaconate CoA-transferase
MLPPNGITVVALEQAVAAPFATRQLADFGARVIKIERPAWATSPAATTLR